MMQGMSPDDLMAAISGAGAGFDEAPPDPGMQMGGGPADPMEGLAGLFAQQPGGEGASPAAGGGGAPAAAPSPAPSPTPAPRPPEMVSALEQLAKSKAYDPKTDTMFQGLGTTAALNNIMMSLGGKGALAKYPWLEALMESARTGTPVSKMKWGQENIQAGNKVIGRRETAQ